MSSESGQSSTHQGVLARKYRPETFEAMIGQQATVRILTNALEQNRVPQAMILSGVRGTGKTTLARLVAKGLNCLSSDRPTSKPCWACQNCREIAAGISLDVREIDAASHTGVDHIRELIDSVGYRPAGRFKVYILDEVHMLSGSAFNALLKTLEEPPEHVKFIFATTELRKIPATVLSRTHRFPLRRIELKALEDYLAEVCRKENRTFEQEALTLIARGSEGSVRDALSMLDQFLLDTSGGLEGETVRHQLGQANSVSLAALFTALLLGRGEEMLTLLDREAASGTEPVGVVRDLLSLCHQLSRHKVLGEADADHDYTEAESWTHRLTAEQMSMGNLARLWQVLLKGADEVRIAPDPQEALERVLIRALFVSEQPTPQQIVEAADRDIQVKGKAAPVVSGSSTGEGEPVPPEKPPEVSSDAPSMDAEPSPILVVDFGSLLALLDEQGEHDLVAVLNHARVGEFSAPNCSLYLSPEQRGQAGSVEGALQRVTGSRWTVHWLETADGTTPSVVEGRAEAAQKLEQTLANDVVAQEVHSLFPGATLKPAPGRTGEQQ